MRIAVIPFIVGVFYLPDDILMCTHRNLVASLIFILAAITDWLDGFLARKWNQTSSFGAFLDQIADKLIVTASLLILIQLVRLDAAIAILLVCREIIILAMREWMGQIGISKSISVNSLGKFKTLCQMIAIPMLLYDSPLTFRTLIIDTHIYGELLIYISAILTTLSILYYAKIAWSQ